NAKTMRVAAYQGVSGIITGSGAPDRISGVAVIGGWFDVLGVKPMIGRTFAAGDEDPASERTIVLSNAMWRSRFSSDSSVVGRTLTLNGTPRRVVGVMPASFR